VHKQQTTLYTKRRAANSVTCYQQRSQTKNEKTTMWANAQRDGRPVKYRWRPLIKTAVWLTPTTRVPCSKAMAIFCVLYFPRAACSTFQTCILNSH